MTLSSPFPLGQQPWPVWRERNRSCLLPGGWHVPRAVCTPGSCQLHCPMEQQKDVVTGTKGVTPTARDPRRAQTRPRAERNAKRHGGPGGRGQRPRGHPVCVQKVQTAVTGGTIGSGLEPCGLTQAGRGQEAGQVWVRCGSGAGRAALQPSSGPLLTHRRLSIYEGGRDTDLREAA